MRLSRVVDSQNAMMVAREEAVEAAKSANFDLADGGLSVAKACKALNMEKELGPSQHRLVLTELAMRLWLEPLARRGPYYSEFEAFLWSHISRKSDLVQHVSAIISTKGIEARARKLYLQFLQRMFATSGKTRKEFYGDMLADVGIELSLSSVEFGDGATIFYERVLESVHREHLLAFYSVGLLLRAVTEGHCKGVGSPDEEEHGALYRYFEMNFPLGGKFLKYAGDEILFKSVVEGGTLSEL